MKKKWVKHIRIFLCVFAVCTMALYGAWRIWLDPYRGKVSTFEQSEKLDTFLSGMQAAEDLEFIINRSDYLAFVGINIGQEVEILLERQDDGSTINKAFTLQENAIATPVVTEPFYSYSVDRASGVGIFTLRQCIFDKPYKTALKDFFTSVRDGGAHSVIVDLRGNPGGDSLVANEFLRYLPVESYQVGSSTARFGPVIWKNQPRRQRNQQAECVFSGNVYVLTGTDSFSAAKDKYKKDE
ncbi:MAG: hypothetical protein GX248_00720 [Peptococcaceae bacterium]|jgi:C-terminal processing protease CtpA/Prc|nr:hypothetical protein [Peptococcaceae bacterium]